MNKLNKIVQEMIEKHEGGEEFFNNLDEKVRNDLIVDRLILIASNFSYDYIIVSGGFGRFFSNYYSGEKRVIVVNGGLRKGNKVDDLSYANISGKKAIFIDDSFYLGRTRDSINTELNKNGSYILKTIVAYDGSASKDKSVLSLYRYYDKHKTGGNNE